MRTRRFNAIQQIDEVLGPIEDALLPLGFTRCDNVFHRRSDRDLLPRVEAVTFGLAYGLRTCWMHTTVKIPALVALLAKVRSSAYKEVHAWRVPDYAGHVACMLRLSELDGAQRSPLPDGLHWRHDGRLQRARSVPAPVLVSTMVELVHRWSLPALQQRLTLQRLADAARSTGYPRSGIAGAWPLAARLALGDLGGAAQAFRLHPYSLGSDRVRFTAAKAWLQSHGLDVSDVSWNAADADASTPWQSRAWLTGELLP